MSKRPDKSKNIQKQLVIAKKTRPTKLKKLQKRLGIVHSFLTDDYNLLFDFENHMDDFFADPDLTEEDRRISSFEDEKLLVRCAKTCKDARYFILDTVDWKIPPVKEKWDKVLSTLIEIRVRFEDMARSVKRGCYYDDATKGQLTNMIYCVESVKDLLNDVISKK